MELPAGLIYALTTPFRMPHALAAATLTLAVACAAGTPTAVSLAQLATDEQVYLGETVQTVGTVRVFGKDDPSVRHYIIEDDHQHRVALLPGQAAASFVGQRAKVVGSFDFSGTGGRLIRIDSIEPSAASAPRGEPSATLKHNGLPGGILGSPARRITATRLTLAGAVAASRGPEMGSTGRPSLLHGQPRDEGKSSRDAGI
ncbi:MAG: hypothetical protein M3N17_07910 [Actinomycetota bacterium]|nr:hypothetical protein [Actinomycetota bacterium]